MNTEFPSRVPTVTNTGSNNASLSTQGETVLNKIVNTLNSIVEKVSKVFSATPTKKNIATTDTSDDIKNTAVATVKSAGILSQILSILNNLVSSIGNIFTGQGQTQEQPSTVEEDKEEIKQSKFKLFIGKQFEKLKDGWKSGIRSLQGTVSSVSQSVGSAVSSVFGGGYFGNMLGKVITRALDLAVGKVLIGIGLKYLPIIAILGSIIATLAYWGSDIRNWISKVGASIGEAIYKGTKWLGNAIDQAIDAVISALPFTSSKYEDARKGLANAAGVTEQDILDYYGDTVEGRNKALEQWRLAQQSPEYMEALIRELQGFSNNFGRHQSVTPESLQYQSSTDKTVMAIKNMLEENLQNRDNMSLLPSDENSDLSRGVGYNYATLVNNTNNNNSINLGPLGNNVNAAAPMSPLPGYASDSWIGGMSMVPAGFYN